jgi:hypothetical protein
VLLKSPKKTLVCELLSKAAFAGNCKKLTPAQAQSFSIQAQERLILPVRPNQKQYFMKNRKLIFYSLVRSILEVIP